MRSEVAETFVRAWLAEAAEGRARIVRRARVETE